ncbi:Cyclin-dependent kinase regulatory subunit [Taenia solium]|eukprot:TsM_001199000 transcript=TsM_001199000 gene=TsM_001199000
MYEMYRDKQHFGTICLNAWGIDPASRAKLSPHRSALAIDIMTVENIRYSQRYYDDVYEYRLAHLPRHLAKRVPRYRLMSESEWRALGIHLPGNWEHYSIYPPEPHVILLRRPLPNASSSVDNSSSEPNSEDA